MSARFFVVKPIYGWGWSIHNQHTIDVPEPFEVEVIGCDHSECLGKVLNLGHSFEGKRVRLSQRHREWDGLVNVCVLDSATETVIAAGFAKVPLDAWNS